MTTAIFYYTGTGNSLWVSRLLAEDLGNASLHPMSSARGGMPVAADSVGLIFPVHMWGVPNLTVRFIEQLNKDPSKYYFAFAVNAGSVSSTLVQLKNLFCSQGINLAAGYDIVLPSNYIQWGNPPPVEKQKVLFENAKKKIKSASEAISKKQMGPIERGPMWERIVFTPIYKISLNRVKKMDKNFWTDGKCNSCGVCEKICPVNNIIINQGKPCWRHKCEQCLACIQWCPQEAIQFGKKTPAYARYHHPEVKLKDLLNREI